MAFYRTDLRDRIIELHRLGYSEKEICAIVHCTPASVRRHSHRQPKAIFADKPTITESKVLQLLAQGLNSKEIAAALGCSYRTIESHVSNMFSKAGVNTSVRLLLWASEKGYCKFLQPAYEPIEIDQRQIVEEKIDSLDLFLSQECDRIRCETEKVLIDQLEICRSMVRSRIKSLISPDLKT